jgi:histidine triad (HIT) family protein
MSQTNDCIFCGILNGQEPGNVIHRDDVREFALIENIHPEGAIHWLAVPFEHFDSVETLSQTNRERLLQLVDFAMTQTKAQTTDFPELVNGFTIKLHCGPFGTLSHAKLHILSTE